MKYISIIFITSIAFAPVNTSCKQSNQKQEVKKAGIDSVAVLILQKEPVSRQVSFPAELIPMEKAEIIAKVTGYVKMLKADIGDHVQQGQVLAVLEAPEYFSNYAQANADVQMARSKYLGSLDTYNRVVNAAKVEGTIAANELEKVKSQMMADSSSLEGAKSRLSSVAQLRDYLTIRAPFSGNITERNVDVGTLAGAGNAKPLFLLENNSSLRLRVPVPEAYTAAVPDSSFIQFTVDAQPGITYKAGLSRKTGALNLTNRTETWEFIYPNENNELKSGMFANAFLKLGRKEHSFVVPVTAVATNLEKRFIIRLRNGVTEWVDVKNGVNFDDRVEIFGDIASGDTLLIRATDEIKAKTALMPKLQAE